MVFNLFDPHFAGRPENGSACYFCYLTPKLYKWGMAVKSIEKYSNVFPVENSDTSFLTLIHCYFARIKNRLTYLLVLFLPFVKD